MRYRVSEDAERDLDEIFVYWANRASLEIADRVVSGCSVSTRVRVSPQVT
jgi:plasmid stabilization system protein ParE